MTVLRIIFEFLVVVCFGNIGAAIIFIEAAPVRCGIWLFVSLTACILLNIVIEYYIEEQ